MIFRRLLIVPVTVMALLSSVLAATSIAAEVGEPVDYQLTLPVDGPHYFSDTFWAGRSHGFHQGQDLMADKMVPIVAAADGVVRLINWTSSESMNPDRCCSLVLRHDDGWESWYIHLNNDTPGTDDGEGWGIVDGITPGTRVKAGQQIAWNGDSGNAENVAPQLHYELRDPSGTIVNPYRALVAAGGNDVGSGDRDPLVGGARVLERGVSGYDVRVLQQTLVNLGYSVGVIDGQFGPATEAAVKAFQSAFGISPDGRVGRTTKTALAGMSYSDESGDILSVGSTGSRVVELQDLLKEKGYDAGPSDGIFGPSTLAAVITFQKAHGLWVDGLVGAATLRELGAAPPVTDQSDEADEAADDEAADTSDTLAVGARGPEVEMLQNLLAGQGYDPGPIDGIFGGRTLAAVTSFQTDHGYTADGVADAAMMQELADGAGGDDATDTGDTTPVSVEILAVGARGPDVVDLQHRLGDNGYNVGPNDGIFGPLTHTAVLDFQRDHGLVPDGKVGPKTKAALGM